MSYTLTVGEWHNTCEHLEKPVSAVDDFQSVARAIPTDPTWQIELRDIIQDHVDELLRRGKPSCERPKRKLDSCCSTHGDSGQTLPQKLYETNVLYPDF